MTIRDELKTGLMRIQATAVIVLVSVWASAGAADIDEVRKQAKSGDSVAQFELGLYFESLSNKERDQKKAVDWLTKAAEQGHAEAQFNLGRIYLLGEAVPRDEPTGIRWLLQAAEQGLADAQYAVGTRYLSGSGIQQDLQLALDMLRKAANQRHVPAQKDLGTLYFHGGAVPKDLVQAHMWFSVAALSDDRAAQGYLPVLETVMDPAQIEEARALAARWHEANGID